MIRWMRTVLPPGWAIGLFILLFVVVEGLLIGILWLLMSVFLGQSPALPDLAFIMPVGAGIVTGGAGLYAGFRAIAFNPLFRPAYRRWLEQTPWTWKKPLPLGPLHLVWQDGVVLALLYGIIVLLDPDCLTTPDYGLHSILLTFFVPYLAILGASFLVVECKAFSYGFAFGFPLLVPLERDALRLIVLCVALYALAWLGIRRMLRKFPWSLQELEDTVDKNLTPTERQRSVLPWPFNRLPLDVTRLSIGARDGFLVSLLVGWWALIYIESFDKKDQILPWLGLDIAIFCLIGIRCLIYCAGYRPPISLLGRIFTLRPVIPGYDKALLAPFCAILVAILVPFGCQQFGVPAEAAYPATAALSLLVILNMGPTLREWQLTGSHRIAPGLWHGTDCIKL